MHKAETIRALQDYGLSEKEAMTYLAALALGPASVLDLAAQAKLTRPTTHLMAKALMRRGFLTEQKHGKRRLLLAARPRVLEQKIAEEKEQLEREERAALAVIASVGSAHAADDVIDVKVMSQDVAAIMLEDSCRRTKQPVCVVYDRDRAASALLVTPESDFGADLARHGLLQTVIQGKAIARLTTAVGERLALPERELGAAMVIVEDEVYFSATDTDDKVLYIRCLDVIVTLRSMFGALFDESTERPPRSAV